MIACHRQGGASGGKDCKEAAIRHHVGNHQAPIREKLLHQLRENTGEGKEDGRMDGRTHTHTRPRSVTSIQ